MGHPGVPDYDGFRDKVIALLEADVVSGDLPSGYRFVVRGALVNGTPPATHHFGIGGYPGGTTVAHQGYEAGWFGTGSGYNVAILCLEIGCNDRFDPTLITNEQTNYTALLTDIFARNQTSFPSFKMVVSSVPAQAADTNNDVATINAAQAAAIAALQGSGYAIYTVDASGINTTTDRVDGLHMSDSGNTKWAAQWHRGIRAALGYPMP